MASGTSCEEGLGQAAGRHDAQGVAIEPGVLGRDPALLAADADADGAALLLEPAEQGPRLARRLAPLRRLVRRQVADAPQHVVQAVGVARPQLLRAVLQVVLHLLERAGSIRSRSSSWPSSSRSRSRSSARATARRSAAGVSPSYM